MIVQDKFSGFKPFFPQVEANKSPDDPLHYLVTLWRGPTTGLNQLAVLVPGSLDVEGQDMAGQLRVARYSLSDRIRHQPHETFCCTTSTFNYIRLIILLYFYCRDLFCMKLRLCAFTKQDFGSLTCNEVCLFLCYSEVEEIFRSFT